MASSSTTSIPKRFKYDVFLSFRGEDVRKTFVDHLYSALKQKSILTYKDDEQIEKGKRINDELIKSIEDSKFFIIIFSKNYSSSSWCLDELVKIMECCRIPEQTAYPVFYDVEPCELRKQSGGVGEAFSIHNKEESVGTWKEALKEAADLTGWELKNIANGHEAKFINKIVEQISLELRSINLNVDEILIGMEHRIKDAESCFETGADDVRMIWIKGIGGGGKTTLARAIFDRVSTQFEGVSFVENVREVSRASLFGLKSLQKQVMSDVFSDQGITVSNVYAGKNMMKNMLCSVKVLIILDDVDHLDQLEALAGSYNWFKQGSLIIITTRDEQLLVAHKVKLIHDVTLLTDVEAICLFSRYAFGREIPLHGYEMESLNVVRYAAGLPLTIKVLGSFLCGKNKLEWIDALERLKTVPLKETLEILEISYISLEDDYKEIFLDVACFLKWWKKEDAIRMLESCGLHARNGLKVLQQKSLITISQLDNAEYLGMHDHIQEMGRNIVRRVHSEVPNRHSRLWIREEIEDVLANNLGTEAIRCIKFSGSQLSPEVVMKGVANMEKLRCLIVYSKTNDYCGDLKTSEVSRYFSNGLRYLSWMGYPHRSLPKTFGANNLVGLDISHSKIVQLWEGAERKVLNKLKFLDLGDSYGLKTLDVGLTPNLETLRLTRCHSLIELNIPIGCVKLKSIDLDSSKLRALALTPNLETLRLARCHDLAELHMPVGCLKLRSIDLNSSKLRSLDIGLTPNLETLRLERCHDLVELHMPVGCLKLRSIELNSSKLRTLALTPNLQILSLGECCHLIELHMPVGCLTLKSLEIRISKLRTLDLGQTPNLKALKLAGCHELVELHIPVRCLSLRSIDLDCVQLRTLDLGQTPNLEVLKLLGCQNMIQLHIPVGCLKLKHIHLRCSKLRALDLTPNIKRLSLEECYDLEELHMHDGCQNLRSIDLKYSKLRTLDLRPTKNLETLRLAECHNLVEVHMPDGCLKLRSIDIKFLKLRTLELTPNLETLRIARCHDLVELHMRVACPKLRSIELDSSKLKTLDLRLSPNLEMLTIARCQNLVELHMPTGCVNLRSININSAKLRTLDLSLNLETLSLTECHDLVELNMPFQCLKLYDLNLDHSKLRNFNLELTPNLKMLSLAGCHDFSELHMPIKCLNLRYLDLSHSKLRTIDLGLTPNLETLSLKQCHELVELNMPNGSLEMLAFLDLSGCSRFKSFVLKKQLGSLEFHLSVESLDISPLDSDTGLPKFWFSCVYEEQLSLSKQLINLGISRCTNLSSFLKSICCLRILKKLTLDSSIPEAPKDLDCLECLEELLLLSTKIKYLPDNFCMLKHLKYLKLESRLHLEDLSKNIGQLGCLEKLHLLSTRIKNLPESICMLKHLKSLELESCWLLQKLPEDLGRLECLESLILTECVFLGNVPDSICQMKSLKHLHLPFCSRVEKLPEELGRLECLQELDVRGTGINRLPKSISLLKGLRIVGSRWLLQSCIFTSKIQTSEYIASCYIQSC